MYETTHQLRVRYAETDQMNIVYYGNYAQYFEVGRVESIRELGFSYKEMAREISGSKTVAFASKAIVKASQKFCGPIIHLSS